jgi:adenosylmethionine-8-amino-7-oxononanoate aminotransferase
MKPSAKSSRPVSPSPLPDWQQLDRQHVWHPLTLAQLEPELLAISRAKGGWLYRPDGSGLLDMISSWWVNVHGHGHPALVRAIAAQAKQLDHVLFGGVMHPAAAELAGALHRHLPPSLSRFFFSESGAVAVEIALKQAFQYWRNLGQPQRRRFVAFDEAYHGETFGTMSVSGQLSYSQNFRDLLFAVDRLPFPATWIGDEALEVKEAAALAAADRLLAEHGDTLAALIIEPLVQGAAGMRMCRPAFLNQLLAKFRAAGVLIIFDEVMVGFGRTGTLFALEQLAEVPDILCLSKGLSGGILPLGLTVTSEAMFAVFDADNWDRGFAHSSSFGGNPIACAAAIASLQLFAQPKPWAAMNRLQAWYQGVIADFQSHPSLGRWRQCGNILAVDFTDVTTDYGSAFSVNLRRQAANHGLLLRPLGNSLYLMPPYCLSASDLKIAKSNLHQLIATVLS